MQQRDHKAMGTRNTRLIRKIKAVALIWVAALFLSHYEKALLSISDGRASSFFNTFLKIITPPPFLRAADFGCKYTKKKRENQRKSKKNQRNSEKIREIRRKTEKNQRKTEKFG